MPMELAPFLFSIVATSQEYKAACLFPFFYNMLPEGVSPKLQTLALKTDEEDDFGLMAATARYDTTGWNYEALFYIAQFFIFN